MKLTRSGGGAKADPTKDVASDAGPGAEDHRSHGLREGLPGLRDLMDRLLREDGCPWDRAQTLDSLRPYLLEETHEVLDAMDDPVAHRKELGDLLFQIVFQSALRERQGHFDLDGVIEGIRSKMIRRHPHVFGSEAQRLEDPDEIKRQWEAIKRAERGAEAEEKSAHDLLGQIPKGLPALVRSWRMQDKAAAVGFDWPDIDGALAKFEEEWREFEEARAQGSHEALRDEYGDLLFVLVRIGQKLGLEPEDALRRANEKFARRFAYVLERCDALGLDPSRAGLDQLESFWQEAKRHFAATPAETREAEPRDE